MVTLESWVMKSPSRKIQCAIEILIAEDSPTQAEQLRRLLENHGYGVTVAANGKEALEAALKRQPALVVSDIIMPEMDGYALCKAIKSEEKLKDIPVVLLTQLSTPEDVIKGLQCEADNFIRKPYDPKYLLSRLESILTNRKLRGTEKVHMGLEIYLSGQRHFITSERQQILDLLISTYEEAVQLNIQLAEREKRLNHSNHVLSGLYRLAEDLNKAVTTEQVLDKAIQGAMELPGVQAAWLSLREGKTGFRLAAARGLPPALETLDAFSGDCMCRQKLLAGDLDSVTNILECERLSKATGDTRGLRYHASVPLWFGNKTVGIMNLAGPDEGLFTDEELKILYGVGNQVAVALERAHLHENLEKKVQERTEALRAEIEERTRAQEAQARLVAILEATTDLVGISDVEGHIVYLNKGGRRMLGIGADEDVSGLIIKDSHPESLRSFILNEAIPSAIRDGVWSSETVLLRRDGREIPVSQVIIAHEAPDGTVQCLSTICRDITERKRNEQEIQHNLERIRALHDIDVAISSTLDLRAVLDVLLEKIEIFLPYTCASTVRLMNRKTGVLESLGCRGLSEEEWKAQENRSLGERTRQIVTTQKPLAVRNVQTDPRTYNPEIFRKYGLVSYLGVPLIVQNETLGVLGLYTKEEHEFSNKEIEFLTTLAGQAAIAINNSQLHEQISLSKRELESTNQYLERSLKQLSSLYTALTPLAPAESVHEMMEGIIERLMEATGADAALIRISDNATGALALASQRGFPDYYLKAIETVVPGSSADGVYRNGEIIIAPDIALEPRLKGKIQLQVGLRSCAMLALKVRREVRGIIHLASRRLGYFDEEQRDHLMAIARQMGIALENRELFETLGASRDQLEKSNKVKNEFLSVMSHELRTPLNVIMGYTKMIQEGFFGELNQKQTEGLTKVVEQSTELLIMVSGILNVTQLEAGETKAASVPVDLSRFLEMVKSSYGILLKKQITLNWDYSDDLPVMHTDEDKLKHILHNLLNNAIKFTENGTVTVSVRHLPEDNRMQFEVADTGVGIANDNLNIIFEMFRQVDSSETRMYGGIGLGLYIVNRYTALLGGTVEVKSEVGKGSRFTVRIPCVS